MLATRLIPLCTGRVTPTRPYDSTRFANSKSVPSATDH